MGKDIMGQYVRRIVCDSDVLKATPILYVPLFY